MAATSDSTASEQNDFEIAIAERDALLSVVRRLLSAGATASPGKLLRVGREPQMYMLYVEGDIAISGVEYDALEHLVLEIEDQ